MSDEAYVVDTRPALALHKAYEAAVASRPVVGWVTAVGSWVVSALGWFVDNVNPITRILGFVGAVMAVVISVYTIKIQRKTWQRMQRDPRYDPKRTEKSEAKDAVENGVEQL
jgi:uncharacterized membrane protein YeaQ/YmgE (transglycosylase-associated protein family)